MSQEIDHIVAVGVAAAQKAGAIQREKFGGILNVDAKLADDIKLEADRLCEKAIVDAIREAFPSHAILAEEGGRDEGSGYRWYIDPLDGTVNFYHGMPYFCTTLSCYRLDPSAAGDPDYLGEPVAGITYAPPTDEMFIGVIGRGTTLNGRPVKVREEESLADALILTAIGNNEANIAFTRRVTLDLSQRVRKTRGMGAAAYDLANVAAGRASGFFEYGLNIWDIAAGRVQVEAADGLFHARLFANGKWAVAASGRNINEEMARILQLVPEDGL